MRLTSDDLAKLSSKPGYRIHAAVGAGANNAHDTGPLAIVERNPRPRALGPRKAKKGDSGVFLVGVKAFRRRLLDEDNLCEKFHVDCCRYAGLLPSDAAGKARITTTQEKVTRDEDERVEITIQRLP